jgi:hypothetical protein
MKKLLAVGVVALLLTGLVGSSVLADISGHKADCQKRWGHCPFQAKPSPTTLTYDVSQCQQPALPYQGPQQPPRYDVPLPDGCYRAKPCDQDDNCKRKCNWNLFNRCEQPRRDFCAPWK